jgi:hypothetical protein
MFPNEGGQNHLVRDKKKVSGVAKCRMVIG